MSKKYMIVGDAHGPVSVDEIADRLNEMPPDTQVGMGCAIGDVPPAVILREGAQGARGRDKPCREMPAS